MIPPEKKIERMVNVARLYYEQNMTQNEIAKELGISRPLVSILLTEASIIPDRPLAAASRPVVTLAVAPLVVHPAHQRRGVGGLLLREAHRIAADLGYGTAVLLGHKDYYPRFGYRRADACGITFPFEAPAECCMVKELLPGALPTARGHVQYPPAFQL